MRRLLVVALLAVAPGALFPSAPVEPRAPAEPFVALAIGCMPYGVERIPLWENLIAEANRVRPAFTVHLGDIKGGGEPPTEEHYRRMREWFDAFDGPLIYTPGDNEWTDVHRESNGRQDPLGWLARIRELYFPAERSLGRAPLPLVTQRRDPAHAAFVENARWERGGVVFATVHVVGSWNNCVPQLPGAMEEFSARDAANIAWVRETFAAARDGGAPGVALFFQADPFAADYGREGYDRGFEGFLRAVEAEARAFGRPVLLVHADDHRYRLDRGIAFVLGGTPAPNVTRLCVFGDADVHGGLIIVDPASPDVFLCGPWVVPANPPPHAFRP